MGPGLSEDFVQTLRKNPLLRSVAKGLGQGPVPWYWAGLDRGGTLENELSCVGKYFFHGPYGVVF